MLSRWFLGSFVAALSLAAAPQEDELAVKFRAFAAKQDRAGLVALWREHPGETLASIDEYLEGSLAKTEEARAKKEKVDEQEIRAMHATALFGASCADEAFGTAIFSDYASSFVGFDEAQQYKFRRGQAAHKQAQALLREKKGAEALEHAKECAELARPLGDWWGTAMGLAAMGKAYEQLEKQEEALSAYSLAALIYHDLRLLGAELPNVTATARLCVELGRKPRAEAAIARGLELATALGDPRSKGALEELKERLAAPGAK